MRVMSATGEPLASGAADAGFTLLEMLVVVGILGLLTAVAFPAVRPALAHIAAESARSDLAANLRRARAQAIRRQATVEVQITPTARGYVWNGHRVELPGGAHLTADIGGLSFASDGASSGGHCAIAWDGRALDVDVDPGTGVVRLEPRAD